MGRALGQAKPARVNSPLLSPAPQEGPAQSWPGTLPAPSCPQTEIQEQMLPMRTAHYVYSHMYTHTHTHALHVARANGYILSPACVNETHKHYGTERGTEMQTPSYMNTPLSWSNINGHTHLNVQTHRHTHTDTVPRVLINSHTGKCRAWLTCVYRQVAVQSVHRNTEVHTDTHACTPSPSPPATLPNPERPWGARPALAQPCQGAISLHHQAAGKMSDSQGLLKTDPVLVPEPQS